MPTKNLVKEMLTFPPELHGSPRKRYQLGFSTQVKIKTAGREDLVLFVLTPAGDSDFSLWRTINARFEDQQWVDGFGIAP